MSESGTTGSTKTFKVQLTAGALKDDLDPTLVGAIRQFEPLPFAAAEDAVRWLRRHISDPEFPLLTVLDLDSNNELLGFCVLGYVPITFQPYAATEVGLDVAWIARSAKTENGFGAALLEYAISIGIDTGATAMIVTPHDEETAEKIWKDRFQFEPVPGEDQPPEAPPRLWYPIRAPKPPA